MGIKVSDLDDYQGQKSIRIETQEAVYVYHRAGAGFASLRDRDGLEWIGYQPGGGSAGEYRGIPNIRPAGFHPGSAESKSRLSLQNPGKAQIVSERIDGAWTCCWDIFPTWGTMTLHSAKPQPYWFLYEGTPGGVLRPEEDSLVVSDGRIRMLSEVWEEALPAPEWVAFRSARAGRSLFLLHHEADSVMDCYWPMEGNMTVFGFGRTGHGRKLRPLMTAVPSRFSIGFVESLDYGKIRQAVEKVEQSASGAGIPNLTSMTD